MGYIGGHYQLTNHLLTSWDFQADPIFWRAQIPPKQKTDDSNESSKPDISGCPHYPERPGTTRCFWVVTLRLFPKGWIGSQEKGKSPAISRKSESWRNSIDNLARWIIKHIFWIVLGGGSSGGGEMKGCCQCHGVFFKWFAKRSVHCLGRNRVEWCTLLGVSSRMALGGNLESFNETCKLVTIAGQT